MEAEISPWLMDGRGSFFSQVSFLEFADDWLIRWCARMTTLSHER